LQGGEIQAESRRTCISFRAAGIRRLSSLGLLVAVRFGVMPRRMLGVLGRVQVVRMRRVGMMRSPGVIAFLMRPGGFGVMVSGLGVMLRRLAVMVGCLL
jgi:hypothetical protein